MALGKLRAMVKSPRHLITLFGCLLCVSCLLLYFTSTANHLRIIFCFNATPHPHDIKHYLSHEVQYLLNPQNLCPSDQKQKLLLIIIVPSAVKNIMMRTAIRYTWARRLPTNVRIAFLVGMSKNHTKMERIRYEFDLYNDIIQANFYDTYRNLTLKSAVMLKWTTVHCRNAEFLMKCDDDVFVNIKKLVDTTLNLTESDKLVGKYIINRRVVREERSSWYVSNKTFPHPKWPLYLIGPSYLMRTSIVPDILNVSKDYLDIPIEDAVFTGICAEMLGIERKEIEGFIWRREKKTKCLDDVITTDFILLNEMFVLQTLYEKCLKNGVNDYDDGDDYNIYGDDDIKSLLDNR